MSNPNQAVDTDPTACEGCGEPDTHIDDCQECCEHEYDPDEGMMCINCDKEYPY